MHWRLLLPLATALLLTPAGCAVTPGSSSGANQLLRTYMHQLLTAAQQREDSRMVPNLIVPGKLGLPWDVGVLAVKSSFDDTIRAGLETIRKVLATTLEPLEIDRISLDSQGQIQGFESKGYMKDVAINKLSEFKVEEVQSNIERLYVRLGVKFDVLDMFADYYDIDAKLENLHVFGNGSMKMRAYDLGIVTSLKLGYRNEQFQVKDVDIQLSLKKAKVILENLMGGGAVGDVTNGVIGDVLPDYIEEFKEEISKGMSNAATKAINEKLSKLSLDDLLALAGVPKPPPKPPLHS